jgi:hypothetical protein
MGVMKNAYRILFGKPVGKRPIRRPRCRWGNNIKMNLKEIGFGGGLDSSGSGLGPMACSLVSTIMNLWDP